MNTIAGNCCDLAVADIMLTWIRAGNPLSVTAGRFRLECTNREHGPFCIDGVTGPYKNAGGIMKCVKLVAEDEARTGAADELAAWAKTLIQNNQHAVVAQAIAEVPAAREAVGIALETVWKTVANMELYAAALRWNCVSIDSRAAQWLLETRLQQPWPARQRDPPVKPWQNFAEAESLRQLGRMALYFEKKTEACALPDYAARRIIGMVRRLMVAGDHRPALPHDIIVIILTKAGFGGFK